jgi:hypothetical protein
MTKTYDRSTYAAARRAWAEGDFRDRRWHAIYRLASERGYIYPPTGTVHDDREDEQPSQRAVVYAAMCDQPGELERVMRRSSSWSAVVAQLITHVERLREDADRTQDDVDWKKRDRPPRGAVPEAIASILHRIAS